MMIYARIAQHDVQVAFTSFIYMWGWPNSNYVLEIN